MSSTCDVCGKKHSGLTRYFQWGAPVIADDEILDFEFDGEFQCRVGTRRFFVSCELELPFPDEGEKPLGFIAWVEVSSSAYAQYSEYRENEETLPPYVDLVEGTLANPIPAIADSIGVSIRFEVLPEDPTPYITWVQPGTSVSARLLQGATPEFWHEAAGLAAKKAKSG